MMQYPQIVADWAIGNRPSYSTGYLQLTSEHNSSIAPLVAIFQPDPALTVFVNVFRVPESLSNRTQKPYAFSTAKPLRLYLQLATWLKRILASFTKQNLDRLSYSQAVTSETTESTFSGMGWAGFCKLFFADFAGEYYGVGHERISLRCGLDLLGNTQFSGRSPDCSIRARALIEETRTLTGENMKDTP